MSEGAGTAVIDNPSVVPPEAQQVVQPQAEQQSAAAPVTSPEAATESVANREVAGAIGSEIIARKTREIVGKATKPQTPGEKALFDAETFQNPDMAISPEDYSNNPDGIHIGGLVVTKDGTTMNVTALKDETITGTGNDRTKTYSVVVEGRTDPVDIDGADLSKAHLKANAEHVGEVFAAKDGTETAAQKLAQWHAEGAQGPPPVTDADLRAIDTQFEAEAAEKIDTSGADTYINNHINDLNKLLGSPDDRSKLDRAKLSTEQLSALKDIELLESSQLEGPIGVLTRAQAVKQIIEKAQSNKAAVSESLKRAQLTLADKTAGATAKVESELIANGMPEEDAQAVIEVIENGKLEDVLTAEPNGKIKAILDKMDDKSVLAKVIFKGNEPSKVVNFLDTYIATLPEDDPRSKAWKYAKGAGITLAVLLALILGTAGLATTLIGKGVAGAGQPQR